MNKFWNFRNQADGDIAELLLYGNISSETWWGDEITPQQFANDLSAQGGKDIHVRINSPGGDVFAAHTISNLLQSYTGDVTVYIDGLAASAATIIIPAGKKCIMPSNAVMMIHNPAVGLCGYYAADDMVKMSKDLGIIKQSIMNAYKTKCNLDDDQLSQLMDDETWLTADMAKQYGFADEIEVEEVEAVMKGGKTFINGIGMDLSKLKNSQAALKILNIAVPKQKKKEADEMAFTTIDDLRKEKPDLVNQITQEAIIAERNRNEALDALDSSENQAVHEIINDAKKNGKTADEVKNVVDIIKKHTPETTTVTDTAKDFMKKAIADNKNSGADGIEANGSSPAGNDVQETAAAVNYMTDIINKKNGVKK